jgi:hypothetical protein
LLVLPQGLVALAGRGVEPHQTRVRLLVRRLARHRLQERLDGGAVIPTSFIKRGQLEEQCRALPPEFLSPTFRPILVAIARQEVSGVKVQRRPVCRNVSGAAGLLCSLPEGFGIHPKPTIRVKGEALSVGGQVAVGDGLSLERATGDVEGLVEVVGGGPGSEVRPEEVHDLLAVKVVIRCESEQLDEARSLPEPPLVLPDSPRTYRDLEAAE